MSLNVSLPGVRQPVIEAGGTASRPYYTFFQSVATSLKTLSDQIDNVTTTPTDSPISENANVVGAYSIYTRGTLKTGIVKVFLLGDVETPGKTQYYGSNADGEKGWYAVADALAASDNVTVTAGTDGVSTLDLSDSGVTAGTYGSEAKTVAVTFDAKGRATGVVEKDIRTLADTAPSSPVPGQRWIDTTTGTEYVWYVDGDSSQWVEFGPNAVSAAMSSFVQSVAPGNGIAVDDSDPFNPVVSYSGVPGYADGTSFPAAPSVNDKFYRTDLSLLCYYDGTRWLSCNLFRADIAAQQFIYPLNASGGSQNAAFAALRGDIAVYLVDFVLSSFQSVAGSTSNFWTISLDWLNASNTPTSLGTITTKTAPASGWISQRINVNAALSSTARAIRINAIPSGSPGVLYAPCYFTYRQIVT